MVFSYTLGSEKAIVYALRWNCGQRNIFRFDSIQIVYLNRSIIAIVACSKAPQRLKLPSAFAFSVISKSF